MATIYSIVYKPEEKADAGERGSQYLRVPMQRANLIAGHGIEGDMKGGGNPARQLNLLSYEWLMAVRARGYKTEPGQFGEQIIVSGLAVETLEPGVRLRLGSEALIEITVSRTGCNKLVAAQGKSIEGLGQLGMLASVITGGTIAVGDPVTLLEPARVPGG